MEKEEQHLHNGNDQQTSQSQADSLSQIKEILFGEDQRDNSKKFQEIENLISKDYQDLNRRIDSLQESLTKMIAEFKSGLEQQLNTVDSRLDKNKTDRNELADMLIGLANNLKSSAES